MNASDDKKIQIQQMVLKSQRSLKAARQHLQDKDFDFTASRAYYAVFYLMEAVKGRVADRHRTFRPGLSVSVPFV